jgi:hypothetical protein
MYFRSGCSFSKTAIVLSLIIPRSDTTHTSVIPKRFLRRSTTGSSVLTSVVFPGHISLHTGRPSPLSTMPTTICFRSGRWSLLCPRRPSVWPPVNIKLKSYQ